MCAFPALFFSHWAKQKKIKGVTPCFPRQQCCCDSNQMTGSDSPGPPPSLSTAPLPFSDYWEIVCIGLCFTFVSSWKCEPTFLYFHAFFFSHKMFHIPHFSTTYPFSLSRQWVSVSTCLGCWDSEQDRWGPEVPELKTLRGMIGLHKRKRLSSEFQKPCVSDVLTEAGAASPRVKQSLWDSKGIPRGHAFQIKVINP